MPYKSKKQRAWMHIHEPEIAEKWDKETGGKIGRRKRRQSKKSKRRWNKRKRKDKATRDSVAAQGEV